MAWLDSVKNDELPVYNTPKSVEELRKFKQLAKEKLFNPTQWQSTGAAAGGYQGGQVYMVGNPLQGVFNGVGQLGENVIERMQGEQALAKTADEKRAFNNQFLNAKDNQGKTSALLNAPDGIDTELATRLWQNDENRNFQNQSREDAQQARKDYLADQNAARMDQAKANAEEKRWLLEHNFNNVMNRDAARYQHQDDAQQNAQQFRLTMPTRETTAQKEAAKVASQQGVDLKKNQQLMGMLNATPIESLLENSTSGLIGTGVDKAAGVFGQTLPGATNAAALDSLQQNIAQNLPFPPGSQSDMEARARLASIGNLGDTTIPREQRLAKYNEFKNWLQMKIASQSGQPLTQQGSGEQPPPPAGMRAQRNRKTGEVRYIPL